MALKVLAALVLLAVTSAEKAQSRWSRQISSYTSDITDWVPLSGPVERELPQIRRQAVAEPRILSEPFPGFVKPTGFSQDTFPSRGFYNSPSNRQLYLQSVPSAPQNYISEQGFNQGLRFGLAQPNFPLSQGFVAHQLNFDNIPQVKPRPQVHSNQVKFEHSPPKASPAHASPVKTFESQSHDTQKFVDGYRAENNSDFSFAKKPQSLQKIKFELADKSKDAFGIPKPKVEREEVQLLYVPLDSLNRGQFNFRSPLTSAQILNTELYNQRSNPLMQNLAPELQTPLVRPMDTFNSQQFLTNFNGRFHEDSIPKFSTATTPFPTTAATTAKPKKLKPHQPPLAIFSTHDAKKDDQVKVGDVLHTLKNANTVAVLDSVNPLNAPKVFIGPSSLTPPENYVKFELPYLSNIENIDKKLKQLPFFVAPLSYNTPQGFAKIPFPSPHVGSVVINSLIKDSSSANKASITDIYSNPYSRPLQYKQEQKPITQKPIINYYTTSSPKANSLNYEQNYYSIEPQAVSTLRPLKETESNLPITQSTPPPYKSGSYFLSNINNQYNPSQFVNFPQETNYKQPEPNKVENVFKVETTTTPSTTVTASKTSTYPSQLLETHNPYSINQAFHYSTPIDYQNFFDEYKEAYNPGPKISISPPSITISSTSPPTKQEIDPVKSKVEQQPQQVSPNYLQNYTPEIHHESENPNTRYPVFNTNDYFTKPAQSTQTEYTNSGNPVDSGDKTEAITDTNGPEYNTGTLQTQSNIPENNTVDKDLPETSANDNQVIKSSSEYDQYDTTFNSQEILSPTSSTTTTTRRPPIRTRGRPRYPAIKTESQEYSTRSPITRRPLRERKPLPTRSRYEPNKITTETPTRKPFDSGESTTKSTRTRTRGRVHYKVPESDDPYTKRNKPSKKENDLAYQRDVLHQNYPVTLMERTSTADIEAITEPNVVLSNARESAKTDDTEDAYSNDKLSITAPINSELEDLPQQYTTAIQSVTDIPYVPQISNHDQDYTNPEKSSGIPQDIDEGHYTIQTSHVQKPDNQHNVSFGGKASSTETETNIPAINEFQTNGQEEVTTAPQQDTKIVSQEQSQEQEENIVETTPSYNRVRVRPGVIRQYHQSSLTEPSRTDRRKPVQPITYRPAFDRRRTTMRIEEIEADLKTKQVHIRPEFQNYKQPVYKPEPSTEPPAPASTTETSTKRGQLRRRRPSYATTSTEATITRRPYEVKNRFRGRRPTEKPTDKPELQTDTSTTVKNNIYNRYSHRPRLSERYNKKPEPEDQEVEDQDLNYSINRPKYAAPDSERWSPKVSVDSFKPYNPNNIAEETKENLSSDNKSTADQLDIITARNEYEDILISVTPAYNNRVNKKMPDIPPTLEALVEQSQVTKSDTTDTMSTFESMLEEVMKSLEEQDENEYTGKVMKHKGGEIGEIPPEKIISSGENYSLKSTTPFQEEATTSIPDSVPSATITEVVPNQKNRRRGFWKKVKVRPVTEGIDAAESQYYPHVVNRLGNNVPKNAVEKSGKGTSKVTVTTYKPNYQFLKDFFETHEDALDVMTNIDIPKITTVKNVESNTEIMKAQTDSTIKDDVDMTTEKTSPGDMDLGTGSPDPTFDDSTYYSEPTEPAFKSPSTIDRSDSFSFMDYLFGVTAPDDSQIKNGTITPVKEIRTTTELTKDNAVEVDSQANKVKITTESSYVPEEITAETMSEDIETITNTLELYKTIKETNNLAEQSDVDVESSSVSSYMDPANVVSTSMSTEVSHETEICFRGKCIKTHKNLL
ncbi:uncharacterized protein LOC112051927 [Bicyclus anynana]|uniref:Uncharacterized protein LOC112051927 n=1 Tax=Bicyclus anynana TaxID=110368 RepID=A0A6J1NNS3_BICAN|nr:uncharacterized protein LOC112051927 [Bicyclus anynana]XP_023946554.2 uncharacterized protein LOC112051927 [Bicyclus anynana]